MQCLICKHGDTRPGHSTVTMARSGTTLVLKGVPAEVCSNCGEAYHAEEVAGELLRQAEQAASAGVQVGVFRYVA